MTFFKGSLSENSDLLLEGELFNGCIDYLTEIVIDTGFSNAAPIIIPDEVRIHLNLVKSKETIAVWSPLIKQPVKCHTTNLGLRLKENNKIKIVFNNVMAIILPTSMDSEILVGSDFLVNILGCKRMIIDFEKYFITLVV